MLNFQEARQIVCLVLHQSNKTSVELLVAIDLVLELALLVPEKLFLVHR